jgi:hypothetical protein
MPYPATEGGGGNPYGFVAAGTPHAVHSNVNPTLTPGFPAGLAADDILILSVVALGFSGAPTVNTPSGWTLATQTILAAATSYRHYAFWKRADGTESGTQAVSTVSADSTTFLAIISAWGGCVGTGSPIVDLKTASGQSTSATSGSVTTSADGQIVLNLIGTENDDATATPPGTFTEAYDVGTALGFNASVTANYKAIPSAGSVGAQTTTLAVSRRWSVVSFGLAAA